MMTMTMMMTMMMTIITNLHFSCEQRTPAVRAVPKETRRWALLSHPHHHRRHHHHCRHDDDDDNHHYVHNQEQAAVREEQATRREQRLRRLRRIHRGRRWSSPSFCSKGDFSFLSKKDNVQEAEGELCRLEGGDGAVVEGCALVTPSCQSSRQQQQQQQHACSDQSWSRLKHSYYYLVEAVDKLARFKAQANPGFLA